MQFNSCSMCESGVCDTGALEHICIRQEQN